MKLPVILAALGSAALLVSSADAGVIFEGPSVPRATDSSIALAFHSAAAADTALSFVIDGYGSLDGRNFYEDVFRLKLNGETILAGTFNLGGGSSTSQTVLFRNPYGATTANPTANGTAIGWDGGQEVVTFSDVLPLRKGLNTLLFSYFSLPQPLHAGFQGLGDEGWGVERVNVGGVPEPSTWSMLGVGFLGLAYAGVAHARRDRLAGAFA